MCTVHCRVSLADNLTGKWPVNVAGCPVQEKIDTRYRIFIGIFRSSQNASYVVVTALLSLDACAESRNGDLLQNTYINLFMQVFHSLLSICYRPLHFSRVWLQLKQVVLVSRFCLFLINAMYCLPSLVTLWSSLLGHYCCPRFLLWSPYACIHALTHNFSSHISFSESFFLPICLQCFDAVGWVAGRASDL